MWNRKWLAAAVIASMGAIAAPAFADSITLSIGPPEPRYEVVPPPRAGFVWAPGYWAYRGGRHHWVAGHWERERHGMYWHPGNWTEREGRWVFNDPGWRTERFAYNGRGYARDRDHDGVPDRADRHPDDPTRR